MSNREREIEENIGKREIKNMRYKERRNEEKRKKLRKKRHTEKRKDREKVRN